MTWRNQTNLAFIEELKRKNQALGGPANQWIARANSRSRTKKPCEQGFRIVPLNGKTAENLKTFKKKKTSRPGLKGSVDSEILS